MRAGIYEVPGTAAAAAPRLDAARARALVNRSDRSDPTDPTDSQGLEIVVRPHHAVWDGRFANNGWLQELPEPVSRIVWDNVAAVSPAWTKSQGLATGDLVDVRVGDFVDVPAGQRSLDTPISRLAPGTPISRSARTARLPIHMQPGMPDGVVAVTLGHGRAKAGRFGSGIGVNVARLIAPDSKLVAQSPPAVNTSEPQRVAQSPSAVKISESQRVAQPPSAVNTSESQRVAQSPPAVKESEPGRSAVGGFTAEGGYATSAEGQAITPHFATGATISKTGARYPLVATQLHDSMENRPLALVGTLEQFRQTPRFIADLRHLPEPVQIHTPYPYTGYKWAMTIDLSACQACGACMVACQAENNVASAGKEECGRGHWMHWLRIDRYYAGGEDDPAILHQIMLCQHCEDAPCENVCPVAATTHSPEGINEMTYNRCVGTRYCSNNCPYKVRRFNFFDYAKRFTDATRLTLAYNPNVTVRGVGVMEKCNYCIQRINEARAQAKKASLGTPSANLGTPNPSSAGTDANLGAPSASSVCLIILRKMFRLERLITLAHVEILTKLILVTGLMVSYAYVVEVFMAWYSGGAAERFLVLNRAFGPYAWAFWTMIACNVLVPQCFWFRRVRRNLYLVFPIVVLVNVGMWFERFVIIVTSLHRDFIPAMWRMYCPTWVEVGLLAGSFGLFFTLLLLFCRFLPAITISELKNVVSQQARANEVPHG